MPPESQARRCVFTSLALAAFLVPPIVVGRVDLADPSLEYHRTETAAAPVLCPLHSPFQLAPFWTLTRYGRCVFLAPEGVGAP
jgi:hypothetical protein